MVSGQIDEPLIKAWDDFDRAAFAMMTSFPADLSEATKRLEAARVAMRNAMVARMTKAVLPAPASADLDAARREHESGWDAA